MSLRNKESLEKLFAETRESVAKRKEREKERAAKRKEREKIEKNKRKRVSHEDYDHSLWFQMHAVDIAMDLCSKRNLNDEERKLLDSAFNAIYPNGL